MRDFKIRNSNKTLIQTARIQTALFEFGFTWHDGLTNAQFMYAVGYSVSIGKIYYWVSKSSFDSCTSEEITLHQLEAMVREKRAEDSSPGCETAQAILGENPKVVPLDGIDYEKKLWTDVYLTAYVETIEHQIALINADKAVHSFNLRFPKTKKR